MIITAPEGILEAPIIRQGRTVSTATPLQQRSSRDPEAEGVGEFSRAGPSQAIDMCECAKVLSLCEINDFCLVQIVPMVSCDSEINLTSQSSA